MTRFKKNTSACSKRYSCPPPEKIVVGTSYAFSWNLEQQPTDTRNGRTHIYLRDYYNLVIRRLNQLHYCNICLYPEISSMGRFHFHGIIEITDIVHFYLCDMPLLKHDSSFEIDTIDNYENWMSPKYVFKCKSVMMPFCESHQLPYCWRKGDKQVKLDALTALKDDAFSRLNNIVLHESSSESESEDEVPVKKVIQRRKSKKQTEYDIKLPTDQYPTEESGPNGEIIFRKK